MHPEKGEIPSAWGVMIENFSKERDVSAGVKSDKDHIKQGSERGGLLDTRDSWIDRLEIRTCFSTLADADCVVVGQGLRGTSGLRADGI